MEKLATKHVIERKMVFYGVKNEKGGEKCKVLVPFYKAVSLKIFLSGTPIAQWALGFRYSLRQKEDSATFTGGSWFCPQAKIILFPRVRKDDSLDNYING